MKEKEKRMPSRLHWSAKLVIKYGLLSANLLLVFAFLVTWNHNRLSLWMAEVSVYLFSESVIGGLLLDVIAKRMGMENEK